ncbi:MAG: UvrB/UvrC motif-containing protein, partial [Bryobacteraceae bacterium]
AVLYADVMTASMKQAIWETERRRAIQEAYNEANGITPQTIVKPIDMSLVAIAEADYVTVPAEPAAEAEADLTPERREALIRDLEIRMREAAKVFDFEKAAQFRDKMKALKAGAVYEQATATRVGSGGQDQ